jgi:hypothetical protein
MVNFYVNRIKQGKMKLKDVPERWYEAVKEALINDGWPVDEVSSSN